MEPTERYYKGEINPIKNELTIIINEISKGIASFKKQF